MLPDQLETPRLRLRPPRAADASAIFARWAQDPDVTRYLTWRPHTSLAMTEHVIANLRRAWSERGERTWIITLRDDDRPLGTLAVRPDRHLASLGYALARMAWGHGYMTEAVSHVVRRVLDEPSVYRVWAVCDIDNVASQRVLEKAGLQHEGVLRRYVVHPNISPEPRDARLYAAVR